MQSSESQSNSSESSNTLSQCSLKYLNASDNKVSLRLSKNKFQYLKSSNICSIDKCSNASNSSNNASLDGSEYSGYQNYRSTPRSGREREQDLRDPIEPLDPHHSYHHTNPNHHYNHHHHRREESVKRRQFTRSLSNTDPPLDEKTGKFHFRFFTFFRSWIVSPCFYFIFIPFISFNLFYVQGVTA